MFFYLTLYFLTEIVYNTAIINIRIKECDNLWHTIFKI